MKVAHSSFENQGKTKTKKQRISDCGYTSICVSLYFDVCVRVYVNVNVCMNGGA